MAQSPDSSLPKIQLLTMFRLGLYQMGLGMMSLLTLGVLNRILIDELKVLPLLAAGAIAMHQFVSPARIWFGQLSDSRPFLGQHRTGYVWCGALLFTTISFVALQVIWQLGLALQDQGWGPVSYGWTALLALMFGLYGLALSASSTPFAALLVDISDDDNRSQLVGVVWSMLMVGIVVGAIISSGLLNQPDLCGSAILKMPEGTAAATDISQLQASINPAFIAVPALVLGLCLLATVGVESKYSRFKTRSATAQREEQLSLSDAFAVLTASRQTGIFFSFLLVLTISIFMQDAVLEPFGGEVFGLCISETTRLNIPFGLGTLFGIGGSGFLILPRVGKKNGTKLGCFGAIACFVAIILSGLTQNLPLLNAGLFGFGLSSGLITAGATSLMLDLTAAETAGTFIGAWGLAQALSRGLATVLGGGVLNLGKALFDAPVLAYSSVFLLQGLGMILAVYCLGRVNIQEFQESAKAAIATVLSNEIEG
ncbi:BCD family MFS transporter [Lyngbya confervoides]|uniref:BCD family MFS transporter n=1 Tax=Lyngbya confervoides BDU141951 TaxID=1574623 RepID=A0ABD4SYC7_9CYAN|nr:BCD family MFS transporter [Lyngbya confervoides]MCM1981378.1 BCD family MFS transporter [Lyngbya confervoides BDU141951]